MLFLASLSVVRLLLLTRLALSNTEQVTLVKPTVFGPFRHAGCRFLWMVFGLYTVNYVIEKDLKHAINVNQ